MRAMNSDKAPGVLIERAGRFFAEVESNIEPYIRLSKPIAVAGLGLNRLCDPVITLQ